jgi:hypothetical protein
LEEAVKEINWGNLLLSMDDDALYSGPESSIICERKDDLFSSTLFEFDDFDLPHNLRQAEGESEHEPDKLTGYGIFTAVGGALISSAIALSTLASRK